MQPPYLRWLEIGLFVCGILFWGLSLQFKLDWMTTLGVSLVGTGLMLSGFKAMSAGELGMWRGGYGVTQDRGLSARLFGLAMGLVGGALLAYAGARILGWDQNAGAFLIERPGFGMIPLGVVLMAIGAANLIGAWNRRGSIMGVFQSLRNWALGLFAVFMGVILLSMGLIEWIAPEAFDRWLDTTFGSIRVISLLTTSSHKL
jgi:hypothetical protein